MSVYRPRLVSQKDGSYFQWSNCTMASAATAIDRHTLGRVRSTGAKMRSCQFDKSGGTDLYDAKTAWSRCYGQYLDVRLKVSWSTFISLIKGTRGAIVLGNYAYIPRAYRSQDYASFGHAVYINEVRSDGALLMYDPLNTKPIWIPQIYIKRFAGYFHLAGGGSLGYGYVQAGYTKRTGTISSGVQLKYGGVKTDAQPRRFKTKVDAKQRRSPYIRTDNVIRVLAKGSAFNAYQKTDKGTSVNGSTRWYGSYDGNVWMHSSLLQVV